MWLLYPAGIIAGVLVVLIVFATLEVIFNPPGRG